MRPTCRRRRRGLARQSKTVNCLRSNTIRRSDERFWPEMTTSLPQMTMHVLRKQSIPEVKSKLLAPNSRKYKDVERADNLWTPRLTPTSTSSVIPLTTIIWSGVVANWPKMKFLSEWIWDNIKIRPSSMLMNLGIQLLTKLSRHVTNMIRQICSFLKQTRPSKEDLRINIRRKMLVKSCTWCAETTCMKT